MTHELRIDATGPEGTLTVTMACAEVAARESHRAQRRTAEAFRLVFETDDEPLVLARVTPIAPPVA